MPTVSDSITSRLADVRSRIERACKQANRDPSDVTLVAVSKGHPARVIDEAYDAGQRVFGENYAQELADKVAACADRVDLSWRFIGHLQRNKAKLVVPMVSSVDTVDSIRLARALDAQAGRAGRTLELLVQVNVANEPQKAGCEPEALPALVDAIVPCERLRLEGLMTIPPFGDDPEKVRPYFARLRELAARFELPQLSMGMSHDLEVAIAEGATMVRVGTAIFGPRSREG